MSIEKQLSNAKRWSVLFLASWLLVLLLGLWIPAALPQAATITIDRGIELYHAGDWRGAIELWETAASQSPTESVELFKYLARAYQQIGQVDGALAYFDRAIDRYRATGESMELGRILTEQAQAYSSLGQHQRAIAMLCGSVESDGNCQADSAVGIARASRDEWGMAAAIGSLGNAYRLQGMYPKALESLEMSLTVARRIEAPSYILAALNSLGNVYASLAKRDYRYAQFASQAKDELAFQTFEDNARGYDRAAVQYFEEAIDLSVAQNNPSAQVRSQLNSTISRLRTATPQTAIEVRQILDRTQTALNNLPDSREKAYAVIKLASFLQLVSENSTSFETRSISAPTSQCLDGSVPPEVIALLETAISIARHIEDRQAESFALGRLGRVYECQGKVDLALGLTHQAQLYALTPDSLYLWEWQAGRLLQKRGQPVEAIAAYERSIASLKGIRGDMARSSREFQLDFRDTVEPVYRQLTALRLSRATSTTPEAERQANLEAAVNTLDELRLAELQDYLGDECEILERTPGTLPLDERTALVSSMIFADRIAIVLTRPDGEGGFRWQLHWIPVPRQEAIDIINDFRLKLEKRSDRTHGYRERAEQLYDWLIRPFEEDLETAGVTTLVFLHDGIFRSVPMAALYDGEQFAIERYAIGNAPTLALESFAPLDTENLQILAFGLTEASAIEPQIFFPPLSNVQSEIERLEQTVPGSKGLLDREFTPERLQQELDEQAYPVLHLATHAQFGFDSRKTFLVTGEVTLENGQAYNEPLTLNRLYRLIESTQNRDRPLELLTLTACETAAGSDRDALGIAGVALQAGARSALATLWQVDDRATAETIVRFYQHLQAGHSKAEALQATQKDWLAEHRGGRYSHPGYWAPFISIGNWL